jgi:hypothetical protein
MRERVGLIGGTLAIEPKNRSWAAAPLGVVRFFAF